VGIGLSVWGLSTVVLGVFFVLIARRQYEWWYAIILGLAEGALFGLFIGLSVGLKVGGLSCCRHLLLRLLLISNGSIPRKYPAFLKEAARHVFLRRVGGGYVFIHRMLMDYFAELHRAPEATTPYVNIGDDNNSPARSLTS